MQPAGLNRGTSGNVSVRCDDGFWITPTGMAYDSLGENDIPLMALDLLTGAVQAYIFAVLATVFIGAAVGERQPSVTSESKP